MEIFGCANNIIVADSGSGISGMFLTLFFARLNQKDASLSYANAGHNPPLLFRAAARSIEMMEVTGIALGMMADMEYEQRQTALERGDVLLLYTDGIVEAMDAKEDLFSLERLKSSLTAAAELSAQEMLDAILADLKRFVGGEAQSDDITAVVIKAAE
ncbi:Stage II sporulation protein E (SpoIIE) [uncultured archaeon]|nr:Stage II sporulation protein E (SpoIIE) [uncultured archaeon]